MAMKKTNLLIILFFLPAVFSAQLKKPQDPSYYYGVGSAPITLNEDFQRIAKSNALNDLASEIHINLTSEFSSKITEKAGIVQSEVESIVKSSIQAELENYELVTNLVAEERYYVLYRLSKIHYQTSKEAKRSKAVNSSIDYFTKAKEKYSVGNLAESLTLELLALKSLDKYMMDNIQTSIDGNNVFLTNEIIASIQTKLNNLKIQFDTEKIKTKYLQTINQDIRLRLNLNTPFKNASLENIPLAIKFLKGNGNYDKDITTKKDGAASFTLYKITNQAFTQIIYASLNLYSLVNYDTSSVLFSKILKSLSVPFSKIEVEVASVKTLIMSSEKNLGVDLKIKILEPTVKKYLSENGFTFVADVSEAQILIKLDSETRQGTQIYGQFSTYLDWNISVLDLTQQTELYKESKQNIKGIKLDFESAGLNAYDNASKVLVKENMPSLITKIFD